MRQVPAYNNGLNQLHIHQMGRLLTLDCFDNMVGHVPELVDWKGLEVVLFEKVERAQAEQFKRDAHVAVVVKPVKHTHTTAIRRNGKQRSETFTLMISICPYSNETGVLE